MGSEINQSFHYDAYYEWQQSANNYEYGNEDNNGYDDGEYVLELKNKGKEQISGSTKPRHKRSESGVYDELDYDLSPRNQTDQHNQTILKNAENSNGCTKPQKVMIISIILIYYLDHFDSFDHFE